MARPDYIAQLHAAKYDLRFCSAGEKSEMLRRYRVVLRDAADQAGVAENLLEAAVVRDFGLWVKQEKLPKPPKPS